MKGYPLKKKWERLRTQAATAETVQPTGIDKSFYLDLAEKIVRTAVPWQSDDGMIIDPYFHAEANSGSARFVGALGQLIKAGRCLDLIDVCIKSYEHCLGRLDELATCPEFWTKEMMYAYEALHDKIEKSRQQRWRDLWLRHKPREYYACAVKQMTNNFWVFAITGEFLKAKQDLNGDLELVDEGLEILLRDFTEYGMYRDPNDPIVYDLVVKQQLFFLLEQGYRGKHYAELREICERGAISSLLTQSVTGETPFGGRSNQYHWVEGHFCCLTESAAAYFKAQGDTLTAGIFKRAARTAALSTKSWILDMEPYRHLKQGFHPATFHGIDSYGNIGIYGILAASLLGTAFHIADDSVAETLTPAEAGGYVFALWPEFHKVFASCGGYHAELDTKADHHYDATGFGRLHKQGMRPESILSASIASAPNYVKNAKGAAHNDSLLWKPEGSKSAYTRLDSFEKENSDNLTIGPEWTDTAGKKWRLADFEEEIKEVKLDVLEESGDQVEFRVIYKGDLGGCSKVTEKYRISSEGVHYEAELDRADFALRLLAPLIITDGMETSDITTDAEGFRVSYRNDRFSIRAQEGKFRISDENPASNRNAVYRVGVIEDNKIFIRSEK
ncbi:MAG: hypothetical protein PHV82_00250 [Victivallaceae bacterium]|nr:hypothetical protein [Victivallaceae bacterium]